MTGRDFSGIRTEILKWPGVTAHPHRFGGIEFRMGSAEVGHLHDNGTLDIPFPRTVRDALLAENLVRQHRWLSNSGWSTFQTRDTSDANHALWLMRISYLRYALKTAVDPFGMLVFESGRLHLNQALRRLLERHLPLRNRSLVSITTDGGAATPC